MVSFSNLLRLKEIRETVHLPGRHRRRRQGSEDLFQHRHCGLHSKWVQNIGMCAYPPANSIFKSQTWLCTRAGFFLCSTKTYWNIFKFVRHHQVVKFVAESESLLNVHICRLKVESGMFGLWQLFSEPVAKVLWLCGNWQDSSHPYTLPISRSGDRIGLVCRQSVDSWAETLCQDICQ